MSRKHLRQIRNGNVLILNFKVGNNCHETTLADAASTKKYRWFKRHPEFELMSWKHEECWRKGRRGYVRFAFRHRSAA